MHDSVNATRAYHTILTTFYRGVRWPVALPIADSEGLASVASTMRQGVDSLLTDKMMHAMAYAGTQDYTPCPHQP